MKRLATAILILQFALTGAAWAKMGSGSVTAKSGDVDIQIFGSLHTYPTFVYDSDFNSDDTIYDAILDEGGWMAEESIRSEARLGFSGKGDHWGFLTILEADFTYSKANGDRGANSTDPLDSGFTGEDFGIEKLEFTYDFGPLELETGWQTKALDIRTGGVLYGDDHPFLGLRGDYGDLGWEVLYLIIQNDIENIDEGKVIGPFDADSMDWRAYSAKLDFKVREDFVISPFYAYSDNQDHEASVHYMGVEAFGKFGILAPRAEFVYAYGDQDVDDREYDIGAFAAFAALEFKLSPLFNPYVGGYYVSGDGDADDDDIEAFNPITNISRYAPTFGMENAFVYRYVPALGNHLYSNVPDVLGKTPGYGGIGNSAKAESPGMAMCGLGISGSKDAWQYKTQLMYFWFDDTGALEDVYQSGNISDDIGLEWDLQITYKFGEHFSVGNVFALFDPGDGVKDLRGEDFDRTAILDTVELKWQF